MSSAEGREAERRAGAGDEYVIHPPDGPPAEADKSDAERTARKFVDTDPAGITIELPEAFRRAVEDGTGQGGDDA